MEFFRHITLLWFVSGWIRKYKLTPPQVKNALRREYMIDNAEDFLRMIKELKGEAEKAEGIS